jgi:hypothetical protein
LATRLKEAGARRRYRVRIPKEAVRVKLLRSNPGTG